MPVANNGRRLTKNGGSKKNLRVMFVNKIIGESIVWVVLIRQASRNMTALLIINIGQRLSRNKILVREVII